MAIPTQTEMFPIVLKYMTDDEVRKNKEIEKGVVASLKLTPEELNKRTRSGDLLCANRVSWAIQHLQRAQLLNRISRGTYQITDEGKELSARSMEPKEFSSYIRTLIAERNPWKNSIDSDEPISQSIEEETDLSPKEAIASAISDLNAALADELIDSILSRPPDFFEQLIIDLLEVMGYGKGEVTQYSNDGGVDGYITTDALGFDPIYTQAKRNSAGNPVGRPDIQKFAGALNKYTRGIFITTSSFTKEAIAFANDFARATIVLVDGKKLADLMIRYNLGVYVEKSYDVKKLDIDYFEQN